MPAMTIGACSSPYLMHSVCPSQDELGIQKNLQYTQRSHFICTIWVGIGRLWTSKHPLGQTVLMHCLWGYIINSDLVLEQQSYSSKPQYIPLIHPNMDPQIHPKILNLSGFSLGIPQLPDTEPFCKTLHTSTSPHCRESSFFFR